MGKYYALISKHGDDLGYELFINSGNISKVEVRYLVPSGKPNNFDRIDLAEGRTNAEAIREYTIYGAGEKVVLLSNNASAKKVLAMIQAICKDAIKDE